MKNYAVWISRPVFVTSTFRDMQAERDWLHARVFPALAERLRERYHHLEPIDLRWGVEVAGAEGRQARELLVLKVCLDEIRRSRPFLIGLIGDRYGWTPPPERMCAAVTEAGYAGELEGRSVTALEIEFGVLEKPGQKQRSHFYLRDPLPYGEMGALAADYSDLFSGEAEAEAHQRLEALKRRLADELPGRVRPYRADWDKDLGVVSGLDAWGEMVLDDLWADLEEETREYIHAAPAAWQQEEEWVLEKFAATQCPDFVGREELIGSALEFASASGATPWCLVATGEAGSGKSSWFGRVWQLLRERGDFLVLAHAAGISARAGSVDAMLRRWIGELAAHLQITDPADTLRSSEDVQKAFAELLSQAAARGPVVCLIDALNQFERTSIARHVAWLPRLWPANARMIVTAIPGEESEALASRRGTRLAELSALDERESAAIATRVCGRYHKTLSKAAAQELLSKKLPDGRSAAGNPLWLELALEELLLLDADDFARAEREFTGTGDERLAAMMSAVAHGFPPDIPSLYATLLGRAERAYGTGWARAFAALLAISRTGWRESDLQMLLPRVTGEGWDPLYFAALRRGFRTHLVQRGASAQWDFSHTQMRAAIERRYLSEESTRRARHALLSAHLAGLPASDPLRRSERMFHLIGADDRVGAASHFGDTGLKSSEVSGATQALAEHIAAHGEEGVTWVVSLTDAAEEDDRLRQLAHRFLFELQDAMANLTVTARLRVGEAAQQAIEKLQRRAPESTGGIRDLAVSYSKLGDLSFHAGNPRKASEFYRKHLELAEKLGKPGKRSAEDALSLRISYERLGILHQVELGEPGKAVEFFQKTLVISDELRRQAPDNTDYVRGVALSHYRLGKLHRELGDAQKALKSWGKAVAIGEDLLRRVPGDTEYACDLEASYCDAGTLYRDLGQLQRAREFFEKALTIGEELRLRVPDSAECAGALLVTFGELGQLHVATGEPKPALEFLEKAVTIGEQLRRRVPDHAEYARRLSVSYNALGVLHRGLGEPQLARDFLEKSLSLGEELHGLAPESAEYTRDLSITCSELGELFRGLGEPQRALEFLQKAVPLCEKLHRRAPESADYARALGVKYERLGVVQIDLGQPKQALDFIQKSLLLRDELWQRAPENALYASDLSVLYNTLGGLHRDLGEPQRGLEFRQKSVELAEKARRMAPKDAGYARHLAVLSWNLFLDAQQADMTQAARSAHRFVDVVDEMRNAGMAVDEVLAQNYREIQEILMYLDVGLQIVEPSAQEPPQPSAAKPAGGFWRRQFSFWKRRPGREAPRQVDPAKTVSDPPPVMNLAVPSIEPVPAAEEQPAVPETHPVASTRHSLSFHKAAQDGDLEEVTALLQQNPELVFSQTDDRVAPLHRAAAFGHTDVVELLLARKAEVDAKDNEGNTPLYLSAQHGQTSTVEMLLAHQADVNGRGKNGLTPLHAAAFSGHRETVEWLLAHGAAVDARSDNGGTPLYLAVQQGNRAVAELLLDRGAEVNSRIGSGGSPLHTAAFLGWEDVAKLLLAHGADVTVTNNIGATPLHFAADKDHRGVAELLLAHQADVNAMDSNGLTPLHLCAREGHREMTGLLLAGKANTDAADEAGQTPLHLAAETGHKEVVELLIASHADLGARDTAGMTPLHLAAGRGCRDAAESLVVHHAAVNAGNAKGRTPLHLAAYWDQKDLVDLLLIDHAGPNVRDKDGDTPLHAAALAGHKDVVETLLASQAEVDARNNNGDTPLHTAALKGHRDVVETLLASHADVDARNNVGSQPSDHAAIDRHRDVVELLRRHRGLRQARAVEAWNQLRQSIRDGNLEMIWFVIEENPNLVSRSDPRGNTPLHFAVLDGQQNAVELLLTHKAEIDAKDHDGATPLHIAALEGHSGIVSVLLEHEADVNARNNLGATPLHMAAFGGHEDIAELLLAHHAEIDPGASLGGIAVPTLTPLQVAIQRDHERVAALLRRNGARE